MKFRIEFKDPDALFDATREAAETSLAILPLTTRERDAVRVLRSDQLNGVASTWIKYGEYICVEIDTVLETATVIPASDF